MNLFLLITSIIILQEMRLLIVGVRSVRSIEYVLLHSCPEVSEKTKTSMQMPLQATNTVLVLIVLRMVLGSFSAPSFLALACVRWVAVLIVSQLFLASEKNAPYPMKCLSLGCRMQVG
ncbi:MAG: hypothetical protein J3Q66DRAFT_325354, partial [Benniella sp.]